MLQNNINREKRMETTQCYPKMIAIKFKNKKTDKKNC